MTRTIIPEELIAAYSTTNYRVLSEDGGFVLRVGQRSDDLARLFEFTGKVGAAFITAENPFSQTVTTAENHANQARLRLDLEAIDTTILEGDGQGEDPAWPPEASFLAIGISRAQASELGRRYDQNAIIWAGDHGIPELLLLQ